mmetsp:Transcript_81842/g.229565  ORF Transcript_81842/g.229565 Transcript_81842/m.229565 type:complete len:475 (+) Transcript_81842:2-1426(+)
MMSSTISIYLAVVLDGSMSRFNIYVFRTGFGLAKPEEGQADWAKAGICAVVFLIWFGVVNVACQRVVSYRSAASEIGGHITAFAGVAALEASLGEFTDKMMWAVAAAIFFGLVVVRLIMDRFRRKLAWPEAEAKRAEEGERLTGSAQESHEEVDKDWKEAACEAEDEAACILSSFVVQELFMKTLFSGEAEEEVSKLSRVDMVMLVGAVVSCFLGVIVTTYAIKLHDTLSKGKRYPMFERWVSTFRSTTAMSTSWLLLRLCFAVAVRLFPDFDLHFVEVISAFLLTALAICAIILLDQLADKIDSNEQPESNAVPLPGPRTTLLDTMSSLCIVEPEAQRPAASRAMAPIPQSVATLDASPTLADLSGAASQNLLATKNLEKAIRSIISSFALAVGLAWEHAFHAATHTIIDTIPVAFLRENHLISKTVVAAMSFTLMLPVWSKHIQPKAEWHVEQFMDLMVAEAMPEKEQRKRL